MERAEDLYEQLKPRAIQQARQFVLTRTPHDLQEEMVAVVESDLQEQIDQTDPPVVVDAPLIWQDGATLTCTLGNWLGAPSSRTYQWQSGGIDVVDATEATYAVQAGDIGDTFTCIQTATNTAGTSDPVTSNAIVVV